jgi:hypothetical protein
LTEAAGAVDPEAEYFQSVEEFFVSRRGDPLFLSNADWLLIRKWRRKGVPLRVVLRGITDALDGHAHSWSRNRKVGSLAYCASEVDAATDRWRRALSMGSDQASEAAAYLARYADALDAAPLGPRARKVAASLSAELRARQGEEERTRDLEPWLAAQEKTLVGAIRADGPEETVAAAETAVERDLLPYRERLPEAVLDQVRQGALVRALLGAHGLERLSLFQL